MSKPNATSMYDVPSGGRYGARGGHHASEPPDEWDEADQANGWENAVRDLEDALSNLD